MQVWAKVIAIHENGSMAVAAAPDGKRYMFSRNYIAVRDVRRGDVISFTPQPPVRAPRVLPGGQLEQLLPVASRPTIIGYAVTEEIDDIPAKHAGETAEKVAAHILEGSTQ
jgi:hypothetical protein